MVLGHYGPFQKTAKTGGGDDRRGSPVGAVASDHPKLGFPKNARGVIQESFLEANEVPRGLRLEILNERAYVCLSQGARVPRPKRDAVLAAT